MLANTIGAPILLTSIKHYSKARIFVKERLIGKGIVLGGTAAVEDKTAKLIFENDELEICPSTKREEYIINYELNGGNNLENPNTYFSGDFVFLKNPVRENYTFCGWYADSKFTKRVDYIDSNTSGSIKLFAKWHLAALNEKHEGSEDMIWSWWYYPQVITDNSNGLKVFWGFTTSDGYTGIAEYNDDTSKITKIFLKKAKKVDDHNGIALELMPDGKIMAVMRQVMMLKKKYMCVFQTILWI